VQTFNLDASNPLGSGEKPRVTTLDDELFDRGNRQSVSIPVAAEGHSFGNTPRGEIRPVKRFDFDRTGELFLQRSDDGIPREGPAACHRQSGAANHNETQ
jgi:hypothetical protein